MFKSKIIAYFTEDDKQTGDGKQVYTTLYVVKRRLWINYYSKINYGLQHEMHTLCENLKKILETKK